jgi:hypothetical protein
MGTWLTSRLHLYKRHHCFRDRHSLLVARAFPPSDYLYENFSWGASARLWRKVRQRQFRGCQAISTQAISLF